MEISGDPLECSTEIRGRYLRLTTRYGESTALAIDDGGAKIDRGPPTDKWGRRAELPRRQDSAVFARHLFLPVEVRWVDPRALFTSRALYFF